MLYISRYIGHDRFGVVDTDDDVETEARISDLYKAVKIFGLDIKGVGLLKGHVTESTIKVYQPVETVTRLQVKTKSLQRVDVKTYGDMITSILWRPEDITEPVTIRLSDFGTSCADMLFSGNMKSGKHKVTVVLDDAVTAQTDTFRVRFTDDSYVGIGGIGVVLDLHDISDDRFAEPIYSVLFDVRDYSERMRTVSDYEDRKLRFARKFYGPQVG